MIWVWLALPFAALAEGKTAYQYFRLGAAADVVATPTAGYALMGGGTDLDEAFRWMCARAGRGDFLVLRAAGTDAYNPYIAGLEDGAGCRLNSVATLIIPSREAAEAPFVAEAIAHAEAIFIAGGDQANYIRYWTGTPVQTGINAAIKRGVPLGGTSAGLAVMGEWVYSAEGDKPDDPNLDSKTAIADPMGTRVTLVHGFLEIPILKGIIADSHFVKRDRMGRLLVFIDQAAKGRFTPFRSEDAMFLAKSDTLNPTFDADGFGIDERTAVLMESDGRAKLVGQGCAYDIANETPHSFRPNPALIVGPFDIRKLCSGQQFELRGSSPNEIHYKISVAGGKLASSQTGGSLY